MKNKSYKTQARLHYYGYDNKENVLSVSKEDDLKANYIWSYNQTYPIAKIENADYATIETVLRGSAQVIAFSSKALPTNAEIKTFLALLFTDTRLNKALVTTYYEYDTFGRLKCIKDDDGHILKTYEYHYKP